MIYAKESVSIALDADLHFRFYNNKYLIIFPKKFTHASNFDKHIYERKFYKYQAIYK